MARTGTKYTNKIDSLKFQLENLEKDIETLANEMDLNEFKYKTLTEKSIQLRRQIETAYANIEQEKD